MTVKSILDGAAIVLFAVAEFGLCGAFAVLLSAHDVLTASLR